MIVVEVFVLIFLNGFVAVNAVFIGREMEYAAGFFRFVEVRLLRGLIFIRSFVVGFGVRRGEGGGYFVFLGFFFFESVRVRFCGGIFGRV